MPGLVRLILFGIKSKSAAYLWLAFSLITAVVFLVLYAGAKGTPVAFIYGLGVVCFLCAAVAYYYAIYWVDKNADWDA